MNSNEILNKIKEINGCKTDKQLADLLGIKNTQVSRWRKRGFYESTRKILKNVMEKLTNN